MSESQMSDKTFAKVFFTTIALLLMLVLVLIFVASINSSEVSARLDEQRQTGIDKVVAERVAPVGVLNVGEPEQVASTQGTSAGGGGEAAAEPMSGDAVYQQACLACHGTGVAGAPKFGDEAAWTDRIAKGDDMLYDHAINGFQGEAGVMPPKGGQTQLSDDEVRAAVDHMLAAVGHTTAAAASAEVAPQDAAASEATETPATETAATDDASGGAEASAISGEAIYQQACVVCHATGVAGAPKFADAAGWADRIAKGNDMLYDHAINGFQGEAGVMPPKGGQTQLSDDEVRAAVDYMLDALQ